MRTRKNLFKNRSERTSVGCGRSAEIGVYSAVNEDFEHRPHPNHVRAVGFGTGSKQKGFTLIEVLVAFTILVASVSVAVVIFGNGLRVAGVADDYAQAIAVAENRLAEVQVAETLLPGESSGAAAEDMAWNVRIAPGFLGEAGADAKPDFYRIAVTVIWGAEDAPRSLTLYTLLTPPQAAQSGEEDEETDETPDGADGGEDGTLDGADGGEDGADEE